MAQIIVQMSEEEKAFLFKAAEKATFGGRLRHWVVPLLLGEAEKLLGMTLLEFVKGVSNDQRE